MASIFERIRLRPTQLRTVADRRLDDAQYLCDSRLNARANAAMYLAGFVVECLLKAKLLEKFQWLQYTGSPEHLSKHEQRIWSLCYRSHDLDEILGHLPEVFDRVGAFERGREGRLTSGLKSVCAEWTIYARYSPRSSDIGVAKSFVALVRELKPCLQ